MNPTDRDGAANPPGASSKMIRDAAILWISRRDAGLTVAEEAEFQAWLAADAQHAAALAALQPAWSTLNQPRYAGRGTELRRRVQAVVARRARRRLATAAVPVLALAVGMAFFFTRPAPESARRSSTVAVRPDRQVLPDGSAVDLNLGAELAIEFTAQARAVRLVRGEALFHVVRDPSRPFVVSVGGMAVRAVGTAFSVRLDANAVDVLVTEGRVAVEQTPRRPSAPAANAAGQPTAVAPSLPSEPVLIDAGHRVVLPVGVITPQPSAPQPVSPAQIAAALAWRQSRVEFDGTPLEEAVGFFNRANSVQLALANSATGRLRITGVFLTTDPEAFSRALEITLGLTVTPTPDGRILLRK